MTKTHQDLVRQLVNLPSQNAPGCIPGVRCAVKPIVSREGKYFAVISNHQSCRQPVA